MFPILFRFPEWVPLLGGEPVTSFGAMMFLSFIIGGFILAAGMEEKGHDSEEAWDVVLAAMIGGIIGAKLFDVLLNFPELLRDPAGVLFSREGLVWYGGFILGAGAAIIQIRRAELPLGEVFDALAPATAAAHGIGRIGCFLVGDDYGVPTDSWVGIRFPEGYPPTRVDVLESKFGVTVAPELVARYGEVVPVHPTQLYEAGFLFVAAAVLWRLRKHGHGAGWLFSLYMVLAGTGRFLVEFVRAKDDRVLGVFTVSQAVAIAVLAAGAWGMMRLRESSRTDGAGA